MTAHVDDRERQYRDRLVATRRSYAQRAKLEAVQIDLLAKTLAAPGCTEQLRDIAHRTRGTAGTLGFADACNHGAALEEAIDAGMDSMAIEGLAARLATTMTNLDENRLG